jgi:hypothetical protein
MMALPFVGCLAAIGAAWAGHRAAALWLWAANLVLLLVLFRMHATDVLKLDF